MLSRAVEKGGRPMGFRTGATVHVVLVLGTGYDALALGGR